jgi:hypothetical protein
MEAIIADGMRGKLNANLACGAACRRGFGRSVLPMRYLRVIARLSLHPFCLSAFSNAIAAVARCSARISGGMSCAMARVPRDKTIKSS